MLGDDVVVTPSEKEEEAIWELYKHYEDLFELNRTFNIKKWLGNDEEKKLDARGAVIETEKMSHVFDAGSKIRQISEIPKGVPDLYFQVGFRERVLGFFSLSR